MARFTEPTRKQEKGWAAWVAQRPPNVRKVAERFDPWTLYRMKSTGQRCTVVSFGEAGDGSVSLTVNVTGNFNAVLFDRSVFGISPDDLEPCDLPSDNEALGTALSSDEVDDNIVVLRAQIRPYLWALDADGKARRKQ